MAFFIFMDLFSLMRELSEAIFLVFLLGGYLVYSRYYAYYLLYGLEKIVHFFKRIFSPFIFFFRYINGIIQKRIGRMKKKWQKRKHQDIKSS